MPFSESRNWNAYWIAAPNCMLNWMAPTVPAPMFRKEFEAEGTGEARLYLAVGGYAEVWMNGRKISDHELEPGPAIYDRHTGYVVCDVSGLLKAGRNTLGIILGNGWYNTNTTDVWHLDKAVWRNYPRVMAELVQAGRTVVATGKGWKVCTDGPIRFDSLRIGEIYDARLEAKTALWTENGFDDSGWEDAPVSAGTGGSLYEIKMPPCRIKAVLPVKEIAPGLFDTLQNMAGRAQITVRGPAGSKITLHYAERLTEDKRHIDARENSQYCEPERFQVEEYTLKGAPEGETWHSRFTYHGFQYIEAETEGGAELLCLEAQSIHTDFAEIGSLKTGSPLIDRLERCIYWSFINNYVNIPTDCPHREKHGWTGDTQLASETGLWHFDLADCYREWLCTLQDTRRANGQLPGMAPTSGWGYNWGNGPVFDSALWQIPYNVYVFTGNDALLRDQYEAFSKYLDFLRSLSPDGLVAYGLGDWQHNPQSEAVPAEFVTTAYYYFDLVRFAEVARLFGNESDADAAEKRALFVQKAFLRKYIHTDGTIANDKKTAYGFSLYTGILPQGMRSAAGERLNRLMLETDSRADFGIVGAKCIPRVLADHGYADTAFRVFTQPAKPGYAYWLENGATTLHENWDSASSLDHIMFGDPSAWMFEYAAGIRPHFSRAGFREIVLEPVFPAELPSIDVSHRSPNGGIRVSWTRNADGSIACHAEIPQGISGTLILPGQAPEAFTGSIDRIC